MKKCELCGRLARMHCESDQANLCWDCDFKVHGANFLVAKHNRTLLCHVCQSPTPWLASGRNLGSAVSVCDSCVVNGNNKCESSERESGEEEEGDYDNDAMEATEEEEEAEIEDAENQVVPWSGESSPVSMSKPISSLKSLSSNEGDGGGGGNGNGDGDGDGGSRLKRMRESLSSWSDDETGCSSSQVSSRGSSNGEASSSMESSRLLKQPKIAEINQSARNQDHGETKSRSTAIISYLKRLQKHTITNDDDASATITGICRLSRDQSR